MINCHAGASRWSVSIEGCLESETCRIGRGSLTVKLLLVSRLTITMPFSNNRLQTCDRDGQVT